MDRLHRSIVAEPKTGVSHLSIEEQILAFFDLCHQLHFSIYWERAIALAKKQSGSIDWKYLGEWADRLGQDWASPNLKAAITA